MSGGGLGNYGVRNEARQTWAEIPTKAVEEEVVGVQGLCESDTRRNQYRAHR